MRFQIDTTSKTITIEESILLSKLIDELNIVLPDDKWKEYTLQQSFITNWYNPYVINPIITQPSYPEYPWTICGTTGVDTKYVYNVELK